MPSSKEVTINEVSSTTIGGFVIGQVWRSLLGNFNGVHVSVPGRPGAWFSSQKRGLRELRMSCFVLGADAEERRQAVTEVANWLDIDTEVKITVSDMPGKYYMGTLSDPPTPDEWREAGVFELTFAIQPYAYDDITDSEAWTSTADLNHTWSPGLLVPTWPVIQIQPTNGTLTGFGLEVNGDMITFSGSVLDDQYVTVNAIVPVVISGASGDTELTGAFNPLLTLLTGVAGTFPTLMPNIVNNVHFIQTGGTATSFNIIVQYRKSYRD